MADTIINNTTHLHTSEKLEYVTSKKILQSNRSNSFFQGVVEGRRGVGKSCYCIKVFHDVFRFLGYSDPDAWDESLKRIKYTIPEVIDYIETASDSEHGRIGLIWDDAGVHASSMKWYTNVKQVHMLQSLTDTVRTSINSMLLTCPNQGQLLKFLRRYDSHIIQIIYADTGGSDRIAKAYLFYTMPSGKRLVFHKYDDFFYVRLPNDIYKRYMAMREEYNKLNIKVLKDNINNSTKKKGGDD